MRNNEVYDLNEKEKNQKEIKKQHFIKQEKSEKIIN